MPRANRFFLSNQIYHITHRCHNREFHLKHDKDKRNWLKWLFEARKRFGLSILNYTITSNHIHLLVWEGESESIQNSMQLIAGCTGQAYNNRKGKSGAFWQDRYHATIIQDKTHFVRCMAYIDLNMVRAGVISHPNEYSFSGYHEIRIPKEKYRLIDHEQLLKISNKSSMAYLIEKIDNEIASKLDKAKRENFWTESIAVGDAEFLNTIKNDLGIKANDKEIEKTEFETMQLKEDSLEYGIINLLNEVFLKPPF